MEAVKTEKQERAELFAEAKELNLSIGTATATEKLRMMVEKNRPKELEEPEVVSNKTPEEKYRKEYAMKLRVEAEERTKFAATGKTVHGRKPSPEEVCMKTHPKVRVQIFSTEVMPDEKNIPSIEFSWGGVRHSFPHGSEQSIPFGLADHLKNGCKLPVYSRVPSPNDPEVFESKRTGSKSRYQVEPLDYEQWSAALKKVKEMGYIPISERT